ncbi:MAG: hypothetical protein R3C01_07915 [Planctomycetaceae bacterium]
MKKAVTKSATTKSPGVKQPSAKKASAKKKSSVRSGEVRKTGAATTGQVDVAKQVAGRSGMPADVTPVDEPRAELLVRGSTSPLLTADEQGLYLNLLGRGASPAAACRQLLVEIDQLALTLEQDPLFAERVIRVNHLLSQNVAAALYRAAMEGSVSAQTFFLKNLPPPEWQPVSESTGCDSDDTDDLNGLTDEELEARYQLAVARYAKGTTSTDSSNE